MTAVLLRAAPVLLFTWLIVVRDAYNLNEDFILDGFIIAFLWVGWVVAVGAVWWRGPQRLPALSPTARPTHTALWLSLLTLPIAAALPLWGWYRDRPRTVLLASIGGGVGGFSLDLRADGTYKTSNYGGVGASYSYGTYTRHDSLLHLSPVLPSGAFNSSYFIVRAYSVRNPLREEGNLGELLLADSTGQCQQPPLSPTLVLRIDSLSALRP